MSVSLRICQNEHPFGGDLTSSSSKKAVDGVRGRPFTLAIIHFIVN